MARCWWEGPLWGPDLILPPLCTLPASPTVGGSANLSPSLLWGPSERKSKSGWDTWSSWINRRDVFCPQEVWDKDHVIHKNVDGLSRLLRGQYYQPPLCGHGKLASESPHRSFWKEEGQGEEPSCDTFSLPLTTAGWSAGPFFHSSRLLCLSPRERSQLAGIR